jgi:hypothetical protein
MEGPELDDGGEEVVVIAEVRRMKGEMERAGKRQSRQGH